MDRLATIIPPWITPIDDWRLPLIGPPSFLAGLHSFSLPLLRYFLAHGPYEPLLNTSFAYPFSAKLYKKISSRFRLTLAVQGPQPLFGPFWEIFLAPPPPSHYLFPLTRFEGGKLPSFHSVICPHRDRSSSDGVHPDRGRIRWHFSDANIAKYDENILTAQHIPRPPNSRYVIPPKYLPGRSTPADDKSQITLKLGKLF